MKTINAIVILMVAVCFSGCAVVETIFNAGVWVGVIAVVVVSGIIGYLISLVMRK